MTFKDFNMLLIRLFLGYLFTSSGLCKLTEGHFGQLIGPSLLIQQLTPHGLRLFGFFIAISQVMVGALVLSQRFSLLGLIMLVPINLGILMVTISQDWTGTPYIDAVLVGLNLIVILYEWNTLKFLLLPEKTDIQLPTNTNRFFANPWMSLSVIALFGFCCLSSRYNYLATSVIAILGYGLTYANIFWRQQLPRPFQWMLVVSLGAILTITFIGYSLPSPWFINPMLLMGGAILSTTVAYLCTLSWVLLSHTNLLKNSIRYDARK